MSDRLAAHGLGMSASTLQEWRRCRDLLQRVEVGDQETRLWVDPAAWERRRPRDEADIDASISDRVIIGRDKVIIIARSIAFNASAKTIVEGAAVFRPPSRRDPRLIRTLVQAEHWKRRLGAGEFRSVADLAVVENLRPDYVMKLLRLAFLCPELKRAVIEGRAPKTLSIHAIAQDDLADSWPRQLERFALPTPRRSTLRS